MFKAERIFEVRTVDVRLEFEANDDFPAATSAFCLILHDRVIQYKPINGEIKKL